MAAEILLSSTIAIILPILRPHACQSIEKKMTIPSTKAKQVKIATAPSVLVYHNHCRKDQDDGKKVEHNDNSSLQKQNIGSTSSTK